MGFLGPGPLETHLDHARAFAAGVETAMGTAPGSGAPGPRAAVDLGSGAGVPGLVLALCWQTTSFLLVDAQERRAAFLTRAVQALGLRTRVTVVAQRAEVLGREPAWRGAFDLVTARGFGRPAVVAECAAPLLEVDGLLMVSEPPLDGSPPGGRWPVEGLAQFGMGPARAVALEYQFVAVRQEQPCPTRFPRRVGVPAKRPLF